MFERWFTKRKLFVSYVSTWNFDQGKLVILGVFMGCDQATRVMRGAKSEIDKIKTLLVVTPFSNEIFNIAHFNARAAEICRTLCKVFGEGEGDFIPMAFL